MKLNIFFLVFVLCFFPFFVMAQGETLLESIERQVQQAEVDLQKIPIFAMSLEALQSDRQFPDMPEELIEVARAIRGGASYVTIGQSEVTVEKSHGFVTFLIEPFAMSSPDAHGFTHFLRSSDPLQSLVVWLHRVHSGGVVFAKKGGRAVVKNPSFVACIGTSEEKLRFGIYEACERFGLIDAEQLSFWQTEEQRAQERVFLFYLMANYGREGVLYRDVLTKALENHKRRVFNIVEASLENTGYITYDGALAQYQPKLGPALRATIHDNASFIRPSGDVRMTVYVYSPSVQNVRIELRYEDGSPLFSIPNVTENTENFVSTTLFREQLISSEINVTDFYLVTMHLPATLKPGKIIIAATVIAVAQDGITVTTTNEPIGSFLYTAE